MTPYRKEVIGDCELYLGDCLELLPTLGKFDAVVTDPPYGINYNPSGGNGAAKRGKFARIVGDSAPFDPSPWLAFPNVILWGANHYADRLPARPSWLVWYKKDGVDGCEFADCEIAWSSLGHVARVFNHQWHGMLRDSERGEQRVHPTQKPVEVMRWCIEQLPKGTAHILDPFMGSGTTGVACVKLGRKFTGIEIDPHYFEVACERIRKAYAQPDFFISTPPAPVQERML